MKDKWIFFLIFLFFQTSCIVISPTSYKSGFKDINSFYKQKSTPVLEPYLKAHFRSGGLAIYTDTLWSFNNETGELKGNAKLYNARRDLTDQGYIEIQVDSVVLFETNRKLDLSRRQSRMATHTIMTVVDASFGVFCVVVPKACWGSCPTFYTGEGDDVFQADAEGFSEAIVPSMEYADVDALYNFQPENEFFTIRMKNEALETHVVRNVKILAVEKDRGLDVYHGADDKFYISDPASLQKLKKAEAPEGNITNQLSGSDKIERFSTADKKNMKSREEIYLKFDRGNITEGGLILNFRQSLMTTYLIYNVMGYMGNTVSDFLAEVEKNNQSIRKHKLIDEELGGIDVFLIENGEEKWIGTFNETGPIASNHQIMPLSKIPENEEVHLKLVLNKGLWRIDYAALINIEGETDPIKLDPESLEYKNEDRKDLLELLSNEESQLVSMPGDEFKLNFKIPESENNYSFFLYTKGYYLEWMRESWLKDKNLVKLNRLFTKPDKFFRKEAGNYSRYESRMEEIFWSSRIDTDNFDYYEN